MTNIKILLAFHKPYTTINSELFVPIHVGRDIAFQKSKDGVIDKNNFAWLTDNTIGDNTGDNISSLNRNYCELTATYWAWKNYDKLGNPDYIGLMHYRTFFDFCKFASQNKLKDIENNFFYNKEFFDYLLSKYDGVIPNKMSVEYVFKKANLDLKGYSNITEKTCNECFYPILQNKKYTELLPAIELFKKTKLVHYKNMFILKKEDFMKYCELIFPILEDIQKDNNYDENSRMLGFIAEYLSSVIFDYLAINKNKNFLNARLLSILDYKNTNKNNILKKLKQVQIKKYILFTQKYHYQQKENMYKLLLKNM